MAFLKLNASMYLLAFCLLLVPLKAQKKNAPALSVLAEAGWSFNYSQTGPVQSSGAPALDYTHANFNSYTWAVGAELKRNKLFYALKLKRVELGDYTLFSGKTDQDGQDFNVYRTISKSNFAAVLGLGAEFNFRNVIVKPGVVIDYLFLPQLNSNTEARISLNTSQELLILTSSVSNKPYSILAGANLQVGYAFNANKKHPFLLLYALSFSYGTSTLYVTNTRFVNGRYTDSFTNTNRGTHLCHQLLLAFPLKRSKKEE